MIHIEQGQVIPENENLIVSTLTGDYEDNALIEFFDVNNTDLIAGAFQAQYVRYGGMVYNFNDPKTLGEEILKIDPESTHTATSYVRMSNELLFQMEKGSLESESLDQIMNDEQVNIEEKREKSFQDSISEPDPILEPEPDLESEYEPTSELESEPILESESIPDSVIESEPITSNSTISIFNHKKKRKTV